MPEVAANDEVASADRLAHLHQSDLVWTYLAGRGSIDDHVISARGALNRQRRQVGMNREHTTRAAHWHGSRMATGVAGVQQPAQRTATAQTADSEPPKRKKCRNYDIFFGCRDPD